MQMEVQKQLHEQLEVCFLLNFELLTSIACHTISPTVVLFDSSFTLYVCIIYAILAFYMIRPCEFVIFVGFMSGHFMSDVSVLNQILKSPEYN